MTENPTSSGFESRSSGRLGETIRRVAGWGVGGAFIGLLLAPFTSGMSIPVLTASGMLYGAFRKASS